MFYSLTGKLVHSDEKSIAIDCGGVAYYCQATMSTLASVGSVGSTVKVYTYLAVRDNAMELYGFSTRRELKCFEQLISVSGIGPKIGIGILSFLTPEQIALAIAADDHKTLTTAPGVGLKTAKRLILELKDKISDADLVNGVGSAGAVPLGSSNVREAIAALASLGYTQSEATSALSQGSETDSVQDLIKLALKNLSEN